MLYLFFDSILVILCAPLALLPPFLPSDMPGWRTAALPTFNCGCQAVFQRRPLVLAAHMDRHQSAAALPQHPHGSAADIADPRCWPKHMTAAYMLHDRNWAAVEQFYMQLVSGQACLSALGLDSAVLPAAGMQQQQQQQQARCEPAQRATNNNKPAPPPRRVTYKLLVSYLGSSFSGWMRGNSHSKPAVQDSLAAAIVATGVCDKPDSIAPMSKRAAARAARRAEARQQLAAAAAAAAGGGDVGVQQAQEDEGAAAPEADSQPVGRVCSPGSDQAAVQPQPQPPQLPFLLCGGRTDAGVSAVGQVASFYSWQPPVSGNKLTSLINTQLQQQWAATVAAAAADSTTCSTQQQHSTASGDGLPAADAAAASRQAAAVLPPVCPLRVWHAELVPRQFHPTFAATHRRYVYLLPLRTPPGGQHFLPRYTDQLQQPCDLTPEQQQAVQAAPDVDPALAHAMLQRLQGKRLDFYSYARDTPQGKDCECTLLVARALLVRLPPQCSGDARQQEGCPCLAVELVADRFLRRMVRVLVGTLVREVVAAAAAVAGGQQPDQDQLLRLAGIRERRATAVSAPALGLCFAAVGFEEEDQLGGGGVEAAV